MLGAGIKSSKAEILLVEDNPGDQNLAREAFSQARWAREPFVVDTGDDALQFLKGEGKYEVPHRPDIIILDLNLPGKSGAEVLAELKNDRELSKIPIVIFSTSGETS